MWVIETETRDQRCEDKTAEIEVHEEAKIISDELQCLKKHSERLIEETYRRSKQKHNLS